MTNTYILSRNFEYFEPKTIEEVVHLLDVYGGKAKVIAGGTDLLIEMKTDKLHPDYLINIARIPALRYLIVEKGIRIGTLTPFRELEKSPVIRERYTALFEAAQSVSSFQIKQMGTIGGNLCHGSPAADSAPPLIALGANVKTIDGRKERVLPLEEFFIGPGKTVLSPKELMVEVQIPENSGKVGSAFLKMGRVSADLSKVSVAVGIERENDFFCDIRIALGAVAKIPLRVKKAEEILRGKKFGEKLVTQTSLQVCEEIQPIDDIRSTAWYRKEISKVFVRDAIKLAWQRAG
jgi:CO/xanthine dehydrogenase FAD-binding subunit